MCTLVVIEVQSTTPISYRALEGDVIPCGGGRKCIARPANSYHRGCEELDRCRDGRNL
ncbi:hypothetical protein LINGRAHAP2_LOCUS32193 [Linum grandiflorum]